MYWYLISVWYMKSITSWKLSNNKHLFNGIQIILTMISGRIFGGICFYEWLFGMKVLLKGGIFRSCNIQGKPCKQPYKL